MYVNKVREKIKELQEERETTCEEIMEQYIVKQFLDSDDQTATITEKEITGEYELPVKTFFDWLNNNGFCYDFRKVQGDNTIFISIPPSQGQY